MVVRYTRGHHSWSQGVWHLSQLSSRGGGGAPASICRPVLPLTDGCSPPPTSADLVSSGESHVALTGNFRLVTVCHHHHSWNIWEIKLSSWLRYKFWECRKDENSCQKTAQKVHWNWTTVWTEMSQGRGMRTGTVLHTVGSLEIRGGGGDSYQHQSWTCKGMSAGIKLRKMFVFECSQTF